MFVEHPLIKSDGLILRRYQETSVSIASEKSSLIVLPTGLGKTIIALMVAAQKLGENPRKKVLFLAPTKPLVVQHYETFRKLLMVDGQEVLTGQTPVKTRNQVWEKNSVIFATPQTIEALIRKNQDLSQVCLIIFDEAHRAVGEYSYVKISEKYHNQSKQAHILGLTASPGADKGKIQEVCQNLGVKVVEAKTEEDVDVKPYVQDVQVKWVKLELTPEFKQIKNLLEEILADSLKNLKTLGYLESAALKKANKRVLLGVQANVRRDLTNGGESYQAASVAARAIKINHAIELIETQGLLSLDEYIRRMEKQTSKAVKNLSVDPRFMKAKILTKKLLDKGFEHPKLERLPEIVKKYKNKKILIFTQYRDSVDSIINKLNENDILAHDFIGQASRGTKKGMTQKKQVEVLDRFRSGDFNALVATSVAEEGLDIPKVDLVIFYEPVPSEIRSIQRRGRTGRTETGEVCVLMSKGTRDEAYYWSSYHKEKRMNKTVKNLKKTGLDLQKTISDYEGNDFNPKGQQPIGGFGFEYSGEVLTYIDNRERNPELIDTLSKLCKTEILKLDVGDFIISDRVCVERKTADDFLQSIIDKRLMNQMTEMKRNFPKPILIIEGRDWYTRREIHPNAIRGVISSITLDYGIPIIPSEGPDDTAHIIYQLAKREQIKEKRPVSLRGEKKPTDKDDQILFLVESLPNVSAVLADRLLTHFGTVEKLAFASTKQLTAVEGVGKKKADAIHYVFKHEYKNYFKKK